jgi:hypothetical protein
VVSLLSMRSISAQTRTELMPEQLDDASSQPATALVNDFIINSKYSRSVKCSETRVDDLKIWVRLLTPVNANFNRPGDPIVAIVGDLGDLKRDFLPCGTVLRGCVEGAQRNGRLRRNGQLFLRFYWAEIGNRRVPVDFIANTENGFIQPADPCNFHRPLTKREKIRPLLLASSRIAIPLAIGSGGLSLAVTTGAGAVIGAVTAENHKYVSGTLRGAWDGAGLNILDPLVCKGQTVQLALGTPILLRLQGPIDVASLIEAARYIGKQERGLAEHVAVRAVLPRTNKYESRGKAKRTLKSTAEDFPVVNVEDVAGRYCDVRNSLANNHKTTSDDPLCQVRRYMDEKNLAAALDAINHAYGQFPDNPEVIETRNELLRYVTGQKMETKNDYE